MRYGVRLPQGLGDWPYGPMQGADYFQTWSFVNWMVGLRNGRKAKMPKRRAHKSAEVSESGGDVGKRDEQKDPHLIFSKKILGCVRGRSIVLTSHHNIITMVRAKCQVLYDVYPDKYYEVVD